MEPEKELLDLISQRTGWPLAKLSDTLEFENDLNLSHEELIDFITEVEKRFQITFTDKQIAEIKTIAGLKELILDQLEFLNR